MNNHWWKSVIKVTMWLRGILRFVVRRYSMSATQATDLCFVLCRCVSHTSDGWGGREQDCNGAGGDQLPLGPGRGPQEEAGEENLHSTAHRSGVKSKVGGGVEGVTFVSFDNPHSIQWTTLWLVCIIILYLHLCPQFMWCSHLVYCPEKTMFARIEYRNRKSLMSCHLFMQCTILIALLILKLAIA